MNKRTLFALGTILLALFFLVFYNTEEKRPTYIQNTGKVFGTYYSIRYQQPEKKDLQETIEIKLADFNNSLSTFNPQSIISRINQNDNTVTTDNFFDNMFVQAQAISKLTSGAFDITVAPLVNAWGFGFSKKEEVTPELIEKLLSVTGYGKIKLVNQRLYKENEAIMLDASAIAKGYACDVIADLLNENNCENYLVDIGGEIVSKGVNSEGKAWRVGINKPIDDPTNTTNEIEKVIQVNDACMATSGNYRQFYFQDGKKYAHTIDPRTGYPVTHNLLSATIIAETCMQADALATACMVLGVDSSLELCNQVPQVACFLIFANEKGNIETIYSDNFEQYLQ